MSMSVRKPAWLAAAASCFALCAAALDGQCPIEQQVVLTIQTSPYPSLPGQAVRIIAFVAPVVSVPDRAIPRLGSTNDLGTYPVRLGQVSTTVTFFTAGARTARSRFKRSRRTPPIVLRLDPVFLVLYGTGMARAFASVLRLPP
jgi:hypothetical protein